MKSQWKIILMAAFCLLMSGRSVAATSQPPAEGGKLPEILLAVPQSTELQMYLGLSGKQKFTIPEIKAEIVIIEIFSMY